MIVILSEVFVREQRTSTQSKDPYKLNRSCGVERRTYPNIFILIISTTTIATLPSNAFHSRCFK